MDIKTAVAETAKLIDQCHAILEDNPATGKDHLHAMATKIESGEITGEKAHRWLGWLQACVCIGGAASLEELKVINHKA